MSRPQRSPAQGKLSTNEAPSTPGSRPPRPQAPMMPVLNPNAAGIDVPSDLHMVGVPADRGSPPGESAAGGLPAQGRRCGATSGDLRAIADGRKECGVTTVALASTGVSWIPLDDLLEARGFEVWLVEAGQRARGGARPKTDVLDVQGIQRRHSDSLRRPSFRPAASLLALRGYHRQRPMPIR